MTRHGMVGKIKPEMIDEYKRLHEEVWPSVLKMIHDCHIRNYSIYLVGDTLFSYFEYIGDDFREDMAKMAEDRATQDWWGVCKPCFEPQLELPKGETWAPMEEVFHVD